MLTQIESAFIGLYLEWFLYGLYSGIFAIYFQCPKKESRTAMIIFYVLCLLYVLSTAEVVCDLLYIIFAIHLDDAQSPQLQIDMQSIAFRLHFVQITVDGCCDVIAQFILIYRCWIVWGKDTRVVIIPSFLAITYIAIWLAIESPQKLEILPGTFGILTASWANLLVLMALAATMAVNTLVTGLIVFRIFKVFLEVKASSVERTLGSMSSASGNPKLQQTIFMIIECAMALFATQLVRIVLSIVLVAAHLHTNLNGIETALTFVIPFHQMLNGIAPTIIWVRVAMRLSFDDEESLKEGVGSLCFNIPLSDPNTPALGSSGSMPPQERNEDNFRSDDDPKPNSLRRVGSCSLGRED